MSQSTLNDPPRRVPAGLKFALWFGAPLGWIGWLVALIGSVVCAVFLPLADFDLRGFDRSAPAEIANVERTRSTENKQSIYAVQYRFTAESGVVYTGTSYTKDAELPDQVRVEYDSGDPERSRIAGMRAKPFQVFVLFVLVVPIVGLALVGVRLVRARRERRLLQRGVAAHARLIGKSPTNVTINRRPVMKLEYEFTSARGEVHRFHIRTHEPERHGDGATVPMVYDPDQPSRATTLYHLPGRPEIVDGELVARSSAIYAVLPILTAIAVATTIVLMF